MPENWGVPQTGEDAIRQLARRITQQTRRPTGSSATSLGPGFAPRGLELFDWNAEEATFNGFFYSRPGALNAPDTTARWMGLVISQNDSDGLQVVYLGEPTEAEPDLAGDPEGVVPEPTEGDPEPDPVVTAEGQGPRSYIRYFASSLSGLPQFMPWVSVGTDSGGRLRDLIDVDQFAVTPDKSLLMWDEAEGRWLPHAYVPGLAEVREIAEQGAAPDGIAPAASPVPIVRGAIGALAIQIPEVVNADPVTVDIYITAESVADVPTVPTTGEPTASTPGDGTGLVFIRAVNEAAVSPEQVYRVVTVARDADGAAAPSAEVTGSPAQITGPDIAVGAVTTDQLLANNALIEALQASTITGISLEIQGALSARPGFLDIIAEKATATYLTLRDGIVTGIQDIFGTVRLLRGVSNPAAAPRSNVSYPAALKLATDTQYRGLCDNPAGTEWVSVDFNTRRLMRHSKTTGALINSHQINTGGKWYSVTRIGSFYYLLYLFEGVSGAQEYAIDKMDASTFVRSGVTVSSGVWNFDPVAGHPAMGTDGTNIVLAWAVSGGDTKVTRLTTNGDSLGTTTCISGYAEESGGVTWGTHDVGSVRIFVSTFLNNRPNLAWDQFGGRANSNDFQRASTRNIRGLWWDGSKMVTIASDGNIQAYSPGPTTQFLTVGNTWMSQDGTKQTALSPTLATVRPARSTLTITTDNPPETGSSTASSANRVGIYAGPTIGPFRLQSALAVGVTSYALTANYTTSGATAPTTNGFASTASNGKLVSEAESPAGSPIISLKGDGSGRVGAYRWAADGKGIINTYAIPAVSPFTSDAFVTRIGDLVVMSGYFSRASGSAASYTLAGTIPVGYRPPSTQLQPAAPLFNSSTTYQIGVNPAGEVTLRQSAATTLALAVALTWITTDPLP